MNRNVEISFLLSLTLSACAHKIGQQSNEKKTSGNPIVKGWYADPEGAVFNKQYWVYPTYSAPYNDQVFLDAFSSDDLVYLEQA